MDHLTRPDGSDPTDFHLTRRTAVSMFFAGYALAAVSAEAAPITTPADGLTIEEVLIPNGAPKPAPGRGPQDGESANPHRPPEAAAGLWGAAEGGRPPRRDHRGQRDFR